MPLASIQNATNSKTSTGPKSKQMRGRLSPHITFNESLKIKFGAIVPTAPAYYSNDPYAEQDYTKQTAVESHHS